MTERPRGLPLADATQQGLNPQDAKSVLSVVGDPLPVQSAKSIKR
jgi:hypothetical protein